MITAIMLLIQQLVERGIAKAKLNSRGNEEDEVEFLKDALMNKVTASLAVFGEEHIKYITYAVCPILFILYSLPLSALLCQL